MRVWKNAPPSLRAVFESLAAHGDNDFIVYEDERWTFDASLPGRRVTSRLARGRGGRHQGRPRRRSRCGTSRSGRSRSGRPRAPARSSSRSTRGGRATSSRTGSTTPARRCCSATSSAASASSRTSSRCPSSTSSIAQGRAPPGTVAFESLLEARRRRSAGRRSRPRGRRDDLLHVRHDRVTRRARSARTATSARTSSTSCMRRDERAAVGAAVDGRRAHGRSAVRSCCPSRSSTSPAVTRRSCRRSRSGRSSS